MTSAEVFLLAENRLLREALIRILTGTGSLRVVGAAPYSTGTLEKIAATQPRIVVIDSLAPVLSAASLVGTLRTAIPSVRIVMVDMQDDHDTFLRAIREGVVGYVLKDASAAEVVSTITAVAAGEAVCPATLSMALFNCVAKYYRPSRESNRGLSRRERELTVLIRERLTNKQIAARLNLSEQTVKNHVHHILRKMGARDRLAIVERAEWNDPGQTRPAA